MRRVLGFSLIEVVLLLFISGIILLMVSRLTQEVFEASHMLDEKARTIQSARMGIEALSSELREATKVELGPNDGEPLTITKVSPSAKQALGIKIDGEDISSIQKNIRESYDPAIPGYLEADLGTVSYSLNDRAELVREAKYNDRSIKVSVAADVNAFVVKAGPEIDGRKALANTYQISLSIEEKRIVRTFVTVVLAPGIRP